MFPLLAEEQHSLAGRLVQVERLSNRLGVETVLYCYSFLTGVPVACWITLTSWVQVGLMLNSPPLCKTRTGDVLSLVVCRGCDGGVAAEPGQDPGFALRHLTNNVKQ